MYEHGDVRMFVVVVVYVPFGYGDAVKLSSV